ncbi:MAG: hypothetical protein FE78DRAFT_132730, partial [Acidomyces sp. 'richmondensis']
QIQYKVEGKVQGVNYRYAEHPDGLNITGFAKNASDGTVEGEAQGDSKALDKFLQHLKMGPPAAQVTKVDHKEIGIKEGDKGF